LFSFGRIFQTFPAPEERYINSKFSYKNTELRRSGKLIEELIIAMLSSGGAISLNIIKQIFGFIVYIIIIKQINIFLFETLHLMMFFLVFDIIDYCIQFSRITREGSESMLPFKTSLNPSLFVDKTG
jgi:hypothetical protein